MAKGRSIALREWTLHRTDYATDEDFRAAVQNEAALSEHISHRLGIAILSAPARKRLGDSVITVGWVFATRTVPLIDDEVPDEPHGRARRDDEPADTAFPDEADDEYEQIATPAELSVD